MLRLLYHTLEPISISHSRFNLYRRNSQLNGVLTSHSTPLNRPTLFTTINPNRHFIKLTSKCIPQSASSLSISNHDGVSSSNGESIEAHKSQGVVKEKSFWGAVSLIIGTAVGPGMLALPAATIQSGPLPSTIVVVLCWVYVISSILLVAELSFAAMEEDGIAEVSFTGLALKAFGSHFGAFVAVVYASLSFSLLVACVSGIGSIVSQLFPWMNLLLAHTLFPLAAGIVIGFFPFKAIDSVNRFLCLIMLLSITTLVAIGLSVARANVFGSFARASWRISSILPAIPVTVLTLGFHVITPFICKIAGNTVSDARKAVLLGGTVPLIMVLSWNLIVLGLAGTNAASSSRDPISLLLSVNPSALSAVQGFAFSALATSLIGYAVSFPKQLLDTFGLIFGKTSYMKQTCPQSLANGAGIGRVGCVIYSGGQDFGNAGSVSFNGAGKLTSRVDGINSSHIVTSLVLGIPVLIAAFYSSTFSRALDFAGVYANCFLFGILPPLMAYVQQAKKKLRSSILPGGDYALLLLFVIALILGIWH
ncbi:hypothetical protein HS088_TW15G00754 [Tripterygium wilfordii]|uniref:Tyrosine-specific transport protein n=1 Tax=Tripterygium wilfordii TaxID=458696 RepID=A0A7J7CMF6_TRIWF|nr:tyrosine-specific transport protein 2 [Tripterygium wilfordii]XP_038724518.1 tyrosine-specific transport protein 2 [Tripterygium wilfordii]XP_038724519.1 tyrosine-specific transport protein 2 [Tripterygium wilfordii]KAF5735253.1 hypothetical protein HS088_TW15G00754 [Tripterygium wilfordii]